MIKAAVHKASSHLFMTGNGRRYKSSRIIRAFADDSQISANIRE